MMNRLLLLTGILVAAQAIAWELEQRPPASGDWGYHPAENASATINPPPFTWFPEKNAVAYTLEIAGDNNFQEMVYTVAKTLWSAHCPNVALSPGIYYWRYRGWDKESALSEWSLIRSFIVPDGLVTFPMPNQEQIAARIPAEHPRLFFEPDDIVPLRELATGSLKTQWDALIKRADSLIANPPDTTEPPLYPKGTERKGKDWKKIWWGNRVLAVKVTDAAATLAFVYRLSGEEKYGTAAHDLIMAFCDWDTKGSTNYSYNDEAAMPLLYYPSRAYTWAYDVFTPEERKRIQEVMTVRGRDCFEHLLHKQQHLWRPYGSHSNRAWHWLGEVATAFYNEIPEAAEWLDYSMTVFYTCYPVWGGADGGWHEGQAYWVSYLNRFMYWALVLDSIYDINAFEKPFFKQAGDFGLYTCPPGTKSGAFGDQAIATSSKSIASFMGLMGAAANNPYWKWFAEQHGDVNPGGYFGFLMAAQGQSVVAQSPESLPSSKVFRDAGTAVLNSNLLDGADNVQIHFKSSPYGTQSHGYNANNAFLLHLNGERALIRSGKRDVYGSPHHKEWMWQTKSDNAILVNGEGQFPHAQQVVGEIIHFFTSPSLDVVAGEAGKSYRNLDRWCRRILFFKPDVIVIHDILRAPEPCTYQWLLHGQAPFELGNRDLSWDGKPGRLDIHFLKPAALDLSQKDTFDTPPHEWAFTLEEWHITAKTQKPSATMDFITLIRINHAEVKAMVEENEEGTALSLVMPDSTVAIMLGEKGFSIQTDSVSKVFFDEG